MVQIMNTAETSERLILDITEGFYRSNNFQTSIPQISWKRFILRKVVEMKRRATHLPEDSGYNQYENLHK